MQSVGIAAKLLKALAAQGGVLPLKDLAAATGMARAKVHRYLASLRDAGLVAQDPESGRYQIGAAAITIGLVGLGRLCARAPIARGAAAPARAHQRDRDGGDLGRARAHDHRDRGERPSGDDECAGRHRAAAADHGDRPLVSRAPARVRHPRRSRRPSEGARPTAGALPSDDELAALLAEIRARNLSRAHGPLLPGVDALAAPVFDYRDKLVAVICVVGRAGAMNSSWDGPVVTSLLAAAAELSRQLGHADIKRSPGIRPSQARRRRRRPTRGAQPGAELSPKRHNPNKIKKLLEVTGRRP